MSGDMQFDTSNGDYKVKNGYVMLYHKPFTPDTFDVLATNRHQHSPGKYLPGHKKLFVCDTTGHVIRKQSGYSKRRQYIFFGKHYYKRRYYLKRVD
ncbi:hypothetical protein A4H97_16325 [Niastella yeongjuensis]|uniref:Uncharacterized protein n=1 Tax=Niastella yeongjuensis TaxID=354355 RepID=A0A1V9E0Y1_9BACT|nr:hypothetical protein A4H97_16325 [Niastella yeongjuensis]